MGEGSGVAKSFEVTNKKLDEAKWWRLLTNRNPKGKRKTKTVNQELVKIEKRCMSYLGRSCGR